MNEKPESPPDAHPDHGGDIIATPGHAPRPTSRVADLSTSKVLAGGMAAATSAVFGSHFGVFGTVGGAAVGSVVTTVGTNLYQRSLERARDRVARQIPIPASLAGRAGPTSDSAGRTGLPAAAGVPAAGIGAVERRASSFPLGRVLKVSLIGAFLCFAVGLGLVTGIEWVKGSPLSGGTTGTSVGQALSPAPVTVPPPVPELQEPDSSEPAPSSDSKHLDRLEKERAKATKNVPAPNVPAPIAPSTPLPQPSSPLPIPLPEPGLLGR